MQMEIKAIHLPDRYGTWEEDGVEFSGRSSHCQQHLCNVQAELEPAVSLPSTHLTEALSHVSDGCGHL